MFRLFGPARSDRGMTVGLRRLSSSILVLVPMLTHAQSVDAVLGGRVFDQSGAALSGAKITVTAEATGIVHSAIADLEGRYMLVNLPPSTYVIRAELDGYAPS